MLWHFTREVAETKSAQVNNFAKENGHPLLSDIEEVDKMINQELEQNLNTKIAQTQKHEFVTVSIFF